MVFKECLIIMFLIQLQFLAGKLNFELLPQPCSSLLVLYSLLFLEKLVLHFLYFELSVSGESLDFELVLLVVIVGLLLVSFDSLVVSSGLLLCLV